jgi:hypothetical protein
MADYGTEFPGIQTLRGGVLIPVGVEAYERPNPDETTTTCYRATQVWVPACTELELDRAFGDLKTSYPEDYRSAALYPVRQQRNRLLAESDWTQALDAPVDQVAWSNYRQALRDITEQENPFSIVWPEVPASVQAYSNWAAFYDGLLVSGAFAAARAAAASSLMINVAYTDCAASLGLARQGIVNVPAIQASFTALLAMLTGDYALTQEQQDELVGLVESCNLADVITLN